MLKIARGYSPEYLLREVATGRENYYTGAVADGEPPGRWWGAGAELLGLRGLVDAQDMRGLYERFLDPREDGFRDPERWDEVYTLGHPGRRYLSEEELYVQALEREPDASAERRAELRIEAGRNARHNVAFFDATFSVAKSITLVHTAFEAQEVAARHAGDAEAAAAWGEYRKAVEDAIWAGNNAGLAYLAEKAGYSRVGHHGGAAGRYVDAHDWVVASFFQHDSRDRDPQLHVHNAILNRVPGPDGAWRTLDGRSLFRWRPAAAAVAERTTEERLTHALGMLVATRPDGRAREVVGVSSEAMSLISTRRHAVTAKAAELIAGFEQRHGRAPNGLEHERLAQQATLLTRNRKSHGGETRAELLDRIDSRIRADIDGGLAGVARAALAAREESPAAQEWSPVAVIELALAEAQAGKSGWTRADLTRAINAALPDYLGVPDGADIGRLLDQLTGEALRYAECLDHARPGDELLPAELRLADGASAYVAPDSALYATPEHVRTERTLLAATAQRDATALPHAVVQRFLDSLGRSGLELGADQAAAVRGVLTSGARVDTLVGPAGTGKSFVVGAIAKAWTDPELTSEPGRVFGLATSQIATDVLADEGLTARNVAAWLGTQNRLATGRAADADEGWRLRAGDLVVVDESAMTDTPALAGIHRHVEHAGAKLLLVGDHRQLAAVGAGGGMDLLAQTGARYELAEARRFAHEWERAASLRLREADQTVLDEYHRHGRLLDAGTAEQAEMSAADAWLADTFAGHRSVLLVDTNEQAARLSARLRTELVRLGRVDEHGVALGLQGVYAGVGDVVQARRNGWELAGCDGNRRGPINRETFRVTGVRADGGLHVESTTAPGERLVLPAGYVAEHLALGYASTVHAAQGATLDTAHCVVTDRTAPAALYVGMSRGRAANTAHVATVQAVEDPADGRDEHALHRNPRAVLATILDRADQAAARSALATATAAAEETGSVRTAAELLADAAQLAATERTGTWLDQLTDAGGLTREQRAQIAGEDGATSLTRILRRAELAGHEARQVLHDAVNERSFDGARNLTRVIYGRIRTGYDGRFEPAGRSWAEWTPHIDNPSWRHYLTALAAAADERARALGRQTADEAPAWAVEALGAVPSDPTARRDWQQRAAIVASYRELRDHEDPTEALGSAPGSGQAEAYAAFRAAWRALGRPEIDREELELSDGQLRMRIRAHDREAAWAPRYVANELAATHQAADHHRGNAALRNAEADAARDPAEQARMRTEAAQAQALADTLDARARELQRVDDARARWLVHTAATRAGADRARAELAARHVDDTEPDQRVTAEEWLAAHRAAVDDDECHREITDSDVLDRPDDLAVVRDESLAETIAQTEGVDLRETAAAEPEPVGEDLVRVPSAADTSDALERADRALAEIRAREALDQQEAERHRAAELARWHADDLAAEQEVVDDLALDRGTDAFEESAW